MDNEHKIMTAAAYLDIETTSLEPWYGDITIVGLLIERGGEQRLVQLVGEDITHVRLIELFKDLEILYTYNGERFDLPFIEAKTGLNPTDYCRHYDLMHACHRRGLYGGMKKVERMLGIERRLKGMNGIEAVRLWRNYKDYGCEESLSRLLEYNREDVLNLKAMRLRLNVRVRGLT